MVRGYCTSLLNSFTALFGSGLDEDFDFDGDLETLDQKSVQGT